MNPFPFGPPEPPEHEDRCKVCGSHLTLEMERDSETCVNCQCEAAGCSATAC